MVKTKRHRSLSRPRLKYLIPNQFGTALAYELEFATPDPCAEQIGYPLENGEPEPMITWNLPCMAFPPGGVAVQVGWRRIVDCCHPTLYSSHEHRHLAHLASPQFYPHFDSGFYNFFLPFDCWITKRPLFPHVPRGFLFPTGFFPSILLSFPHFF